jgi:hypothetical protein
MSKLLDNHIAKYGERTGVSGEFVRIGYQDIEKYAQERAERYAAKLILEMSVGNITMRKSPTTNEASFDIPAHLTYEHLNKKI